MGSKIKILIYFFMFISLILTTNILEAKLLGYPEEFSTLDNPYKLMVLKKLHYRSYRWVVFSNRKDAPMFKKIGKRTFIKTEDTADYLEAFWVKKREGKYLQIIPYKNSGKLKKERWMNMKDLILSPQALQDEQTKVYFRVFPSLRISEVAQKIKIDDLRFRDGPGEPGKNNNYHYLISREEAPENAAQFLYVYAVYFEDNNDENYLNTKNFNNASYYLVGTSAGFFQGDVEQDKKTGRFKLKEGRIKGWLPMKGVILNFSRQFLEINPKRKYRWGHIFLTEPDLKRFFDIRDKQKFVRTIKDRIIEDRLISPPKNGQSIRWFILEQEPGSFKTRSWMSHQSLKIKYLRIGYPVKRSTKKLGKIDERGLVDLQDWSKKIRIFFLIDATTSMKPCIEAVKNIVKKFKKKSSKNIEFFAAVYRDDVDGMHRFEIWNKKGSLYEWLKNIKATDYAKDSTFEESLFYGIEEAIEQWGNMSDFDTPAVRIMFILGDTGNDDSETDSSLEDVIQKLKENVIFPYAIHFKHPVQNPNSPEKEKAEIRAIKKFKTDMKKVIYGFFGRSQEENICYSEVNNSGISQELENQINNTTNTMRRFVNEIKSVRLGQETLTECLCKSVVSKPDDIKECIKCKNTAKPLQCISKFCSKKGYTKRLLLPAYLINLLSKENQNIYKFLRKKPKVGIGEGWVAIKVNGEDIYRTVLFLRDDEIEVIQNRLYTFLRHGYPEERDFRKLGQEAVKTILGYLCSSIFPSDEEYRDWFKAWIGVDIKNPDDPMEIWAKIASKEEYIYNFRKKVQSIYDFIGKLRRSDLLKKKRMYKDLQGGIWWWVYPEEVIAMPKNKKD